MQLWINKINESGGQDCFPQLLKFAAFYKHIVSQNLTMLFSEHLSKLIEWFLKHLSEDHVKKNASIENRFQAQAPPEFILQEEETQYNIKLRNKTLLKSSFCIFSNPEIFLSILSALLIAISKFNDNILSVYIFIGNSNDSNSLIFRRTKSFNQGLTINRRIRNQMLHSQFIYLST
ncbi:hypothetical protein RN001_013303 [Aquatica leii]|uniref:Uncharacterized protein n=1 Tax=Aquatica leii TaxID=1421715 RepID=A0AAN7SLJ7_9COLE|nr:hypothetical protein RN001_013303 [Aquatica leii]